VINRPEEVLQSDLPPTRTLFQLAPDLPERHPWWIVRADSRVGVIEITGSRIGSSRFSSACWHTPNRRSSE